MTNCSSVSIGHGWGRVYCVSDPVFGIFPTDFPSMIFCFYPGVTPFVQSWGECSTSGSLVVLHIGGRSGRRESLVSDLPAVDN